MVKIFSEIAFLSDRDLNVLLTWIEDNNTLQIAVYDCDPFVRERLFSRFSYIGWKCFEMDRAALVPPDKASIATAQSAILDILNWLIENRSLEDYPTRKAN